MSKIVYYSEFDKGGDHTEQVKKALQYCKTVNAGILHFEPGVYHFYGTYAGEYECNISNHSPNGRKKVIFPIIGYSDFRIQADDCLFIIHDFCIPFVIAESENITVTGPTIEAVDVQSAQGTVVKGNNADFTVKMDGSDRWDVKRGVLVFPYGSAYTECDNYILFDSEGNRISGVGDHGYYKILAEKQGEDRIVLQNRFSVSEAGQRVAFYGGERRTCVFFLRGSSGIQLGNITVTRHTGMGVIAQVCENISIENLNVIPKTGNVISTEADATHFVNCSGIITLKNCVFENMMDDALNVHGIFTKIVKSSPGEIVVRYMHSEAKGIDIYRKGDVISVCDKDTVLPIGTFTVKEVENLNSDAVRLSFEDNFSAEEGMVIENLTRQPKVYMSGCKVKNNRARGILLGSKGKIIISENYFRTEDPAVLFECDSKYWFESGSVNDVYIEGNIFDNCASGCGKAIIETVPRNKMVPGRYFHGAIRLLENKVLSGNPIFAFISNAKEVSILENISENRNALSVVSDHVEKLSVQNDAVIRTV